jgi:hypothetical protein
MCQHCIDNKIFAAPRIDYSLSTLQGLLQEGYSKIKWIKNESDYSNNDKCAELNGLEWTLEEFLQGVQFDAPIYTRSHVNCLCILEVSHENGTSVKVNYAGLV